MAQFYNISNLITNELPKLQITDDLIVTVNNRKSTMLNIQAMMEEDERKPAEEQMKKDEFMNKMLDMLVGGKHAKEIDSMDLPMDQYTKVYEAIMNVAQGNDPNATPSEQ